MPSLQGKTLFITGASRGIGLAIGVRAATDGANIVIASKTAEAHPKLPGTIHTAAEEIEAAGGKALALQVDIRFEDQIEAAAAKAVERFGGIDVLVNNASAISLTSTLDTPMKRFDLMFGVNVRGTFASSRACISYLKDAANPHILNMAPPLNMSARWFRDHCAYTMAKYGMSMCVLGMSEELHGMGIAVNALWPRTVIRTAALAMIPGIEASACRKPEIVADAACAILSRDSSTCTGNFFIDEEVLREEGVEDFDAYAMTPGATLMPDLFLD